MTFRGREPRAIPAGMQEFHFVSGGRFRAEIVQLTPKDDLVVHAPATGRVPLPMAAIKGFLTMPVAGKAGRRAVELVTGDEEHPTGMLDQVLDRRTASYEGVIEAIDGKDLSLDHERMRKTVPLKIVYLAGVRLARETRNPRPPLPSAPFVKIHLRDHGAVHGLIHQVRDGVWTIRPLWRPGAAVASKVEEITEVEVLNGQGIYVSQLEPVKVREKTVLAPAQPYRRNLNSLGNAIRIAGNPYPWGIGVHANSRLTFDVGGAWAAFEAAVGIDDAVGDRGSVVFTVLGDGKELYHSGVVRGSDASAVLVRVPINGVKRLTLAVDATDDLDLGDVADWAAARLLR